jgi:hypothetical protein
MGFAILTILFIIMGKHWFPSFRAPSNRCDYYRLRLRKADFDSHQRQVVHVPLLYSQFLREFWSQYHHIRHSWRGVPHPLSVYRTRYFCSKWKIRCSYRSGWVPTHEEHRWYKRVPKTRVRFFIPSLPP